MRRILVFLIISFLSVLASGEVRPGSGLNTYWPVEEQVNLLENGTFNRGVGGLPAGWALEGAGRCYLFNRGAYHAAGLEVTDRNSPGAMLVSPPVNIRDSSGTWVLTGLFSGGPGQEDEVIPVDEKKTGGGVIEVRCYDAAGKRLDEASRFVFRGRRQGMHLYRVAKEGRIFRRFTLPPGTSTVRIAWGLQNAVGRVTADDLIFFRDTFVEKPSLPVVAYTRDRRNWVKAGWPEAILVDGIRDPGPEGDINPVLAGVAKYPANRYLLQSCPEGVIFDLGSVCAVEGMEITLTVSVPDVVDRRQERFEPCRLHLSFSDDGVSFTPPVELCYRPELMGAESLMTLTYTGFRRLARYLYLSDSLVLSEVKFFGEKARPVLLGYRPVVTLAAGKLTYGVEIEISGQEDSSFLGQRPQATIYRIDRKGSVEVQMITSSGSLSGTIPVGNLSPEKIGRTFYWPDNTQLVARNGADLKIGYRERVEVWDSPTTHAFKTERILAALEIKQALPGLPEIITVNQELEDRLARLKSARPAERKRLASLANAELTPKLQTLGVEPGKISEFFSSFGVASLTGPELLPEKEFTSPDGKYLYRLARKSPDSFVIRKYDRVTGQFLSGEGHRGNYVTAGQVTCQQPRLNLERRLSNEEETLEKLAGLTDGWEKVNQFFLERGFRAAFRISFELPESGFWTLCYKTLGNFPESKMFFNGQPLTTPFRSGQQILPLPEGRSGKNELMVLADATSFKFSLESKPFSASFYHFILLKTAQPVFAFSNHHCFYQGSGEVTIIYGGEPVTLKIPEVEFQPAAIQFRSLLQPTEKTGIVTTRASDGQYVDRDGQQVFLWGGHWNHVPSKETIDLAVRLLPGMGVSSIRQIYGSESELDQATGQWKPEALDNVFYQVARFGQAGIYLDICLHSYGWYTDPDGAFYIVENGQDPRGRPISRLWNPTYLRAQKNYARELLTTVNPYTGKRLVDDPTLIAVEIANEDYGLGARKFDFEELAEPERTLVRQRFNEWLLQKYKTREKLAEAWAIEPLTPEEDPARGTIHFPPQFKTVLKSPNFFHRWDAEGRVASPRVSDALEWCWTEVYSFLRTMHDYLRSLGVKCSISWCGFSTYEIQMTNLHPYLQVCDSLGGSAYGAETNFRSLERWYKFGVFNHVWNKSTHVREWSAWNQGGDVAASTNGLVTAGLFGLAYGLDQWSHHKLGYGAYPSLDEEATSSINPDTDQRRAPFSFVGWAFRRAKIPVEPPRLLVGVPRTEACYGGLNSPCDTQPLKGGYCFLYDQVRMDYYLFDRVYDGPPDMVVLHEGRSPSGDYRRAKHAILWSHGKTDVTGRDQKEREKWFALHGITFKPGERWKKTEQFLAFNCDLVDDPELNGIIYDTLTEWGVKLPFSREEIHRVYATLDRSIEVSTEAGRLKVDRDDFQGWLGQKARQTGTSLLSVTSPSDRVQLLAIPFDTGSFQTAKQIALWSRTEATVTLNLAFVREPEIWAVNWLGYRKHRVYPLNWDRNSLTLRYQPDFDVHFYEIIR